MPGGLLGGGGGMGGFGIDRYIRAFTGQAYKAARATLAPG